LISQGLAQGSPADLQIGLEPVGSGQFVPGLEPAFDDGGLQLADHALHQGPGDGFFKNGGTHGVPLDIIVIIIVPSIGRLPVGVNSARGKRLGFVKAKTQQL